MCMCIMPHTSALFGIRHVTKLNFHWLINSYYITGLGVYSGG